MGNGVLGSEAKSLLDTLESFCPSVYFCAGVCRLELTNSLWDRWLSG